jgi:hypothetical protein
MDGVAHCQCARRGGCPKELLVWDEETREISSPDAWHQKRLADREGGVPNIASQTVIHVYEQDEFVRTNTLANAPQS